MLCESIVSEESRAGRDEDELDYEEETRPEDNPDKDEGESALTTRSHVPLQESSTTTKTSRKVRSRRTRRKRTRPRADLPSRKTRVRRPLARGRTACVGSTVAVNVRLFTSAL